MKNLSLLSAVEVVAKLRNNAITSSQAIEAMSSKLNEDLGQKTQLQVNATPIFDFNLASRLNTEGNDHTRKKDTLLCGLPVLVKDLTEVASFRCTRGSFLFKESISMQDDYLVQVMKSNGAIIVGKTNTSEFGAGAVTFNDIFGVTRNPLNLGATCGGSSGGAAAAVSSHQAWLASGTDMGGSVRIPASFCNVVGMRPSPGVTPYPAFPLLQSPPHLRPESCVDANRGVHNINGPIARNVSDAALFLDAMTSSAGWNSDSVHQNTTNIPRGGFHAYLEKSKTRNTADSESRAFPLKPSFKYAWMSGFGKTNTPFICSSVVKVWNKAMEIIGDEGNPCEVDLKIEGLHNASKIFHCLRSVAMLQFMESLMIKEKKTAKTEQADLVNWMKEKRMKPEIIWNVCQGYRWRHDKLEIEECHKQHTLLKHGVSKLFDSHDILITPTVLLPAFDAQCRYVKQLKNKDNYFRNGVKSVAENFVFENYVDWLALTYVVTVMNCPAISIPCGTCDFTGMPVGIQLISRQGNDMSLLLAASYFEHCFNENREYLSESKRKYDLLDVGAKSEKEASLHHNLL